MITSSRRSTLIGAAILAVLLAVAVLMPAMAFATAGDSEANAVPMSIGTTVTGTLVPLAGHPTKYVFENSVNLAVGQTIVATHTCAPAVTSPDMGLWGQFPTDSTGWVATTSRRPFTCPGCLRLGPAPTSLR